ncbi:response regulator [Ferruginibacter sp.]
MVVLVVDSSVLIIERLQHILSEATKATAVYGAVSYKDALRFLKKIKIDVVLLDSGLPGNTALNLLNEINAAGIKTTVIMLTYSIDHYLEEKYKLLGAELFFDKYHDFEKLPSVINNITAYKK